MFNTNTINYFGILFMSIAANYTGELFSCDTQRVLTNNIYSKHLISFLLLLFFVVLTNKEEMLSNVSEGGVVFPEVLRKSALVYSLFLLSTNMTIEFTIATVVLLIIYMLMDFEKGNKSENMVQTIEKFQQVFTYIIIGLLVIGTGKYYLKQRKDYGNKFSHKKFIFGTNKCKNI